MDKEFEAFLKQELGSEKSVDSDLKELLSTYQEVIEGYQELVNNGLSPALAKRVILEQVEKALKNIF